MIEYSEIDVDLVDLDTFELFPGADEFSNEFSAFALSRLRFKFEDPTVLEAAIKKLIDLNLSFKQYAGVYLESDSELENYPLVIITFNSEYGILIKKAETTLVQEKTANSAFNKDIESGELIVNLEAKVFLEKEIPSLNFNSLLGDKQGLKYFHVSNLDSLLKPRILLDKCEFEEFSINDEIFYQPIESDGRMLFSNDTFEELKLGSFMAMNTFIFNDELYTTPKTVFVVSGEFALKFKANFNFKKENISILIPPLA